MCGGKMENKNNQKELKNKVLRTEVNLIVYPFFSLNESTKKIKKIEFKEKITRSGIKIDILWGVYPHNEYGTPTNFDKRVYLTIMEMIDLLPKPIANPIPIGSIYSMLTKMKVSPSERNYKRFINSIERIIATKVRSEGTFYVKNGKIWINDFFGIFDRIVWKGEKLTIDSGMVEADQNYLYIGQKLLENINANYIKPLDMNYYNMLKKPMATRLYEILGVKFFALFQNEKSSRSIKFSYELLCDLMPVTKQKQISLIKQQFLPSLEKLKSTGFLSNFEIAEENEKIYVYFYPGPRALDEFKRFNSKLSNAEKYEISDDSDDSDYDLSSPDHNHASQGALLAQDNIPQNKEDKEAFEIVTHFYQKLTGNNGRIPSDRELIQARKLIDEFGKDVSMYIVDYALEEAPKTKFNIKTFGAVMQYAQEAASAYEKNIEDRKAKEESAKTAAIRKRLEAQIRQIKDKLSEAEYDLVEKEAFKRAMKKHPGLVLEDGTPHHDLGAFVYGEELDLVIVDWYINKKPDDITKPS